MATDVPVSFDCKRCGTKLSWPDDAVDSTSIDCKNCGLHFGTYADLRDTAIEAVKTRIESIFNEEINRR